VLFFRNQLFRNRIKIAKHEIQLYKDPCNLRGVLQNQVYMGTEISISALNKQALVEDYDY
jgi:hypothetical protein